MSKNKKTSSTVVLAPAGVSEDGQKVLKALVMRREGHSYEAIGESLGVSGWQAQSFASLAYARLSAEAAEELRAQVEDRLDDVLRRLNDDLRLASSQTIRNGIYSLILKTEAQRSKLLGLDIPNGAQDA
ncbi:hypothetical protein QMG83_03395 [Salinibacterium sp. G-O1]|uniref:hypothetical protein n=1 Tax=Salinibacterium sp. G-O1 TaxID=3046208 RepID=UPI0024B89DD8|nr:hypothetical protein [Salinibacterium sp. G-O1]MDJ0334264.1 hypothetical protein [Salinibacterium sp. G-O1]